MDFSREEQTQDDAPNDSLTLGQLKRIVKQLPNKQKPREIAFVYSDADTLSNEIEEFYSYVEVVQCLENKKSFAEGYEEAWTESTISERQAYVEYLLERLELKDPTQRFASARNLLYIAQGTFGEVADPEQHLKWIIANNKLLRKCGALLSYYQALKLACRAHDHYSRVDLNILPADRQIYLEDSNTEIGFYLTLLYMLVEINRSDMAFGTELAALEPPLAVFLFETVASLREKNAKGYPVKKLLLLLWKVILASFGGLSIMKNLKNVVRGLNGLPHIDGKEPMTKSTPMDYYTFQSEVSQKYPTYTPPSCLIPMPVLNAAMATGIDTNAAAQPNNVSNSVPKSRKQQFQTNQRQPFIFPFSNHTPTVPRSIVEAGDLYLKFMYTSVATWQYWQVKEELRATVQGPVETGIAQPNQCESAERFDGHARSRWLHVDAELSADLDRLRRVETLYKSVLPYMQNIVIVLLKLLLATVSGSNGNSNSSKSADNGDGGSKMAPSVPNGRPSDDKPGTIEHTVEEVDIMRHREITSKAVSAILLLMLKHLKLSHVMKFEYLSQLLVDSNCLLLILKIFGLQDVGLTVKAKNEVPELNFFHYCTSSQDERDASAWMHRKVSTVNTMEPQTNGIISLSHPESESDQHELEVHDISNLEKQSNHEHNESTPESSSVDSVVDTDYCWRNLFAAINFLQVLQKLTKKKTHRILLLVQYKSSAILKRILRVSHPLLELYTLKVLKNQVPFVGRKWKQNNMKVITSIYLTCRPDLRDEWIASSDAETEVEDALPQEQSLRELIKHYNSHKYPPPSEQPAENLKNSLLAISPDIFPPHYTKPFSHTSQGYIADDIMLDESFLSNWEQWLQEEVYSFSTTKPHLQGIDEYYSDEYTFAVPGDGSEWDVPVSPIAADDPFTVMKWENLSSDAYMTFETKMKSSGNRLRYNEEDMEHKLDALAFLDSQNAVDFYSWPDEMLGPLAMKSEVQVYEPTPYNSESEDL